jgi:flagellar hook-associated protein 1 FlgK
MGMSSLRAQSKALETVSRNMANVNNTGYSRQRVVFGDPSVTGGPSTGVEVTEIRQLRDVLLDRQVTREKSVSASLTAETSAYERGEAALGESVAPVIDPTGAKTVGGNSIADALAVFFGAARQLAASPTDAAQKQMLVQAGTTLSDRFKFASDGLDQVRNDLSDSVRMGVDEANQLLGSIREINGMIATEESTTGFKALALRDQRQTRLEDLAQICDFEVSTRADAPNQIEISAKSSSGARVVMLSGDDPPLALTFDGSSVRYVGGVEALDFKGGSIKGNLGAREGALKTLADDLDKLAGQVASAVNAAYNPGSVVGQDFFDSSGMSAGTLRLASGLTAASVRASGYGGAAGDSSAAVALSNLDAKTFSVAKGDSVDGTFAQSYSGSVARFSHALSQARMSSDNQDSVFNSISAQRDSVSGVSLDEEAAELMKFQRAYQAAARVVTIIDQMLDLVTSKMGA